MTERYVKVYPRFERFWHWSQMALIMVLLATGLALNGLHTLIPFGPATMLHIVAALALIVLWVFAIFWHLTTGTWKHYVPTRDGLLRVAQFYVWGIFKGEPHPYRKAYWRKHNPLQAITYLALKIILFPAIWISGLLALGWNLWEDIPNAAQLGGLVSNIHLLAAYAIAAFVVAHVYLLTVGHSFREHVKPMITGFDKVNLTPEEEAYLEADEPGRIKPRA
ncbi:cytochrome B [Roseovarius gahaiensis]|uniref:Cytochrome B n=1 Tax=Roseovarius gahaiensis TaxID=2716691 RepID=A0A967BER7_9RHOB|nr:cytochrome b/b6 domain-containing protein [Roseovarius gahaiensis]NHQ75563.1 cytochrome B [Roseovarius gahaiensis]